MSGSADPPHVPAWKKIGLKLKNAKEDTNSHSQKVQSSTDVEGKISRAIKKRKVPEDAGVVLPAAIAGKKHKKSRSNHEPTTSGHQYVNGKPNSRELNGVPLDTSPPPQKRKSVSFTPETKVDDGEGVKHIYQLWLKSQKADDPNFDASTLNLALKPHPNKKLKANETASVEEPVGKGWPETSPPPSHADTSKTRSISPPPNPPTNIKRPKKKKKPKDQQKDKLKQPKENLDPSAPHLTYLTTHHDSLDTWKFSKPIQNHILKHLFSLRQMPSTYDQAILSYLKGLKGRSARQRIRSQALDIRKQDDNFLASPSKDPISNNNNNNNNTSAASSTLANPNQEMSSRVTPTPSDPETLTDPARHARNRTAYLAHLASFKQSLKDQETLREDLEWEFLGGRAEWEHRLRKRKRAEIVLWGVGEEEEQEQVDQPASDIAAAPPPAPRQVNGGGHAKTEAPMYGRGNTGILGPNTPKPNVLTLAAGKKIVFGDSGSLAANTVASTVSHTANANGVARPAGASSAPAYASLKERRCAARTRRKQRRTGVPDDDDDDSDSSSSSSNGGDGGEEQRRKRIKTGVDGEGRVQAVEVKEGPGRKEEGSDSNSGSGSSDSDDSDDGDESEESD